MTHLPRHANPAGAKAKDPRDRPPPPHPGTPDRFDAPATRVALEPPKNVATRPYRRDTRDLGLEVADLEKRMRASLNKRLALHRRGEDVLLNAFRAAARTFPDPHHPPGTPEDAGGPRATVDQFVECWRRLKVDVPRHLAKALFNRIGQDVKGRLPWRVFSASLLAGPARTLAMQAEQMPGPLSRNPARLHAQMEHRGAFKYPECRKPVYMPTTFTRDDADRSNESPKESLTLEWVHGYNGRDCTAPNLGYSNDGHLVYAIAALAVVLDPVKRVQRHFMGHDDDVTALALSTDRTLCATGQCVGTGDRPPKIMVWNIRTLEVIAEFNPGREYRAVVALCFSPDGRYVASVGSDNQHSLILWDTKTGDKLDEAKTMTGTPPTTYGVVWSPFTREIVTYGVNSIKFFAVGKDPRGRPLLTQGLVGEFGKAGVHVVGSACFLPSGDVISGHPDGSLCTWRTAKCIGRTPAHGSGPPYRRPDGKVTKLGVRALVFNKLTGELFSGGADGLVKCWDASSGSLGKPIWRLPMNRGPDDPEAPKPIRALDFLPGSQALVVGNLGCEIWEANPYPFPLVVGHSRPALDVAIPPSMPHLYATTSSIGRVLFWNAEERKREGVVLVSKPVRSLAFHPTRSLMACGTAEGGIVVVDVTDLRQPKQVAWIKTMSAAIDEMKFSPDGSRLACGSHDQCIDIYDTTTWKRTVRCVGHSSTVTHVDWSTDSSKLMSNDQAYELLYFDAATGKQIKANQRDTAWHTFTCVLGFNVMGIWPRDSNGTDINGLDRSPTSRFVATADDFGNVNLLHYPCVVTHAPRFCGIGHSSHVMSVRWSPDEKRVYSVGGRDRAIFQWRLENAPPAPEVKLVQAPFAPDLIKEHPLEPQAPLPHAREREWERPQAWRGGEEGPSEEALARTKLRVLEPPPWPVDKTPWTPVLRSETPPPPPVQAWEITEQERQEMARPASARYAHTPAAKNTRPW